MSLLFSCQSITKSFASRVLFRDLSFGIFLGDRIGLIGPNGSGKSTLLKIIAGIENQDSGIIAPNCDLRIGYVPQTCDFPDVKPIDVLLEALESYSEMADYEKEQLAKTWLSRLGFLETTPSAAGLSGGWKKRLAFAKELIRSPNLLLLDEPTNHLDLEGILWLEQFLIKTTIPYVLVSHDRYFLQNVTNRIIEIDKVYPKGLMAIDGSYANFLEKKQSFVEGQIQQERSIASKARREADWLSRSPKARTTKAQSRVDEANEILDELSQVQDRNRQKKAGIDFVATQRETRKLLLTKNLSKEINGRLLFHHLDLTLSPGSRIGLMGPNGSGKTTLLRLLAGEIMPDQGTIKKADALKIVYFDQHRTALPDNLCLREALSPRGDFVYFRGKAVHINGWCKRFLFSPDLLNMPIANLSGGERARISIAHLMLQEADLLLLDEPTNDLDIPTLETLEESLLEFPGAIVLISHDRCMLDRICNTLLSLGQTDQPTFYPDYAQWTAAQTSLHSPSKSSGQPTPPSKGKLSYQEKREYDQIERKIAKLETEVRQLNHCLEDPQIAQNSEQLQQLCSTIGLLEMQIEQLYLRWDELEKQQ